MNEAGRDNTTPQSWNSGFVVLLVKLWFILMVLLMGLWVLGVILMYWHVIIPVGILGVAWASRSGTPKVSGWACDEPSSEDGQ